MLSYVPVLSRLDVMLRSGWSPTLLSGLDSLSILVQILIWITPSSERSARSLLTKRNDAPI
jgi:hypothetical protein